MQQRATEVKLAEPVFDYLQALVGRTRDSGYLTLGLSPRGAISLYRASQGWAYMDGRDFVLPDDVKAVFVPVCGHRVVVAAMHASPADRRHEAETVLDEILETTPVPV